MLGVCRPRGAVCLSQCGRLTPGGSVLGVFSHGGRLAPGGSVLPGARVSSSHGGMLTPGGMVTPGANVAIVEALQTISVTSLV